MGMPCDSHALQLMLPPRAILYALWSSITRANMALVFDSPIIVTGQFVFEKGVCCVNGQREDPTRWKSVGISLWDRHTEQTPVARCFLADVADRERLERLATSSFVYDHSRHVYLNNQWPCREANSIGPGVSRDEVHICGPKMESGRKPARSRHDNFHAGVRNLISPLGFASRSILLFKGKGEVWVAPNKDSWTTIC